MAMLMNAMLILIAVCAIYLVASFVWDDICDLVQGEE
jgi:hypothetical protein